MEDRALRTNQMINRYQGHQTMKLGSPEDNHYVKKENWKQIDEKNKNQFRGYEKQTLNLEPKTSYQSYQLANNDLDDKDQYNNNTNLKQSYYYEQTKPQTSIYYSREDKQDQVHLNRQNRDEQPPHSSDKYYSKQSAIPQGNRTPMDSRSNFNSKNPLDNDSQNKFKSEYQFSGFKTDFKWPEYQRMYPEITKNKNNQQENNNQVQQGQSQDSRGLLDIEQRLQQRREQAEKIAGQQDKRLNYYSKSQEYSQRQQQVGLESNQEKMKQFQRELRNEVQERIKEQTNQLGKQDYRNFELNSQRSHLERDMDNKHNKNEILELDQFKYSQQDAKLNLNERKNNYYDNSRKDYAINSRGSQFDEKSPFQSRFNHDSKFQEVSNLEKYHYVKKQQLDPHQTYDDKVKYVDRSLKSNKSQNEEQIKFNLKSEGSTFKESNDRFQLKDKLNYETKQQPYQIKREEVQSQGIQTRHDLYDKLQQFDQKNSTKYYDSRAFQADKFQSNNFIQETKPYDQYQSIEPKSKAIGYNTDKYDKYEIKMQDQQMDKMEFKRSQFQPEINQLRQEFDKKYGQFNPEVSQKLSEIDKRRIFEDRSRPEPIQTKISGAREYLGQKYYQRDPYRFEQRHSYHEESSHQDRLAIEKGNSRNNADTKAIEDILQGTALNKYIQREKQNKVMDRVVSFTSSNINYQKSPINDKEQQLGYDRQNQLQRGFGNDRYAVNEYQKRLSSDKNLQKYGSPSGQIFKQSRNYDTMDRRI